MGRGRVLGAVLTKFQAHRTRHEGYDYAYDYHYGAAAEAKPDRKV